VHHIYSVIQVQLILQRLDDGSNDEAETVKDGIYVQSIQKPCRVLVFWRKGSNKYCHVEVDADLGEVVSQRDDTESIVKQAN
jgi:hypothetical protein